MSNASEGSFVHNPSFSDHVMKASKIGLYAVAVITVWVLAYFVILFSGALFVIAHDSQFGSVAIDTTLRSSQVLATAILAYAVTIRVFSLIGHATRQVRWYMLPTTPFLKHQISELGRWAAGDPKPERFHAWRDDNGEIHAVSLTPVSVKPLEE
jgi:hypothetical protein